MSTFSVTNGYYCTGRFREKLIFVMIVAAALFFFGGQFIGGGGRRDQESGCKHQGPSRAFKIALTTQSQVTGIIEGKIVSLSIEIKVAMAVATGLLLMFVGAMGPWLSKAAASQNPLFATSSCLPAFLISFLLSAIQCQITPLSFSPPLSWRR